MSRIGSITMPSPRSGSATTKLALPSSGARTTSTVNIRLAKLDRNGREEDVDRGQRHHGRAAVEDHLRGDALRGGDAEVDEQVAQAMGEVKERKRDQDEQVELHQRVAEDADPGVVVAVDDRHDAQWAEDALDQHVHGDEQGGDDSALGEHEPPEEMHQRRSLGLDL